MTTSDINQIQGSSPDLKTELARQLEELVPEAITDGKVDVAKLGELLADDAGDENERFGLFWPGKRRAMRAAQEPTTATLKPMKDQSKDWDTTKNVFIEGDNLEVLKVLQKHYHNKIKAIYIDPPYNTGNDFVYRDDYTAGLAAYLEFSQQADESGSKLSSNTEADGRFHSNWLNMMYPRLKLARNLLTEDGAIFVSIDDNEITHLRKLLDEVFGEACFVGQLTTLCNPRGRSQDKYFGTNHEYVLVYSRTVLGKGSFSVAKEADQLESEYGLSDERGNYRLMELRNSHREFGKHNRPNLYYPFYATASGEVFLEPGDGRVEVLPTWNDGFEGCWTWGREKAARELSDLMAKEVSGRFKVFQKDYAEGSMRMLKTILNDKRYFTDAGQRAFSSLFESKDKLFQAPKSVDLVGDLLATRTSGDDLVLDFFAGSGTTAHAVMALNARDGGTRRCIQVQLPERTPVGSAASIAGFETIGALARERMIRAAVSIDGDQTVDRGFRFYSLVDTHLTKWRARSDVAPEALQQQLLDIRDSANDSSSEDSLLAELLLKHGYSLTETIDQVGVAGLSTWRVADGGVVAYLDEHTKPSLDQLRALAEAGARKLLVLEDAFQGDDELKTNLVQLCKTHGVELWTA